MKVQLIMTILSARSSGKVNDAQQVVVFVNISKNTFFITVINNFAVFFVTQNQIHEGICVYFVARVKTAGFKKISVVSCPSITMNWAISFRSDTRPCRKFEISEETWQTHVSNDVLHLCCLEKVSAVFQEFEILFQPIFLEKESFEGRAHQESTLIVKQFRVNSINMPYV